jgi:peptidoglycan/LPS O-acetylase OafA/YrhL
MSTLRSFFESLRRHTSSGLYIPQLDGLRFVAISSVLLFHVAGDILRHTPGDGFEGTSFLFLLTQQLNVGVPLFFVISGMILGLPFAKYWLKGGSKVSYKRYLLRRITRLEPPYVIVLILFFCLKMLGNRGAAGELFPHLGASLIYLHNLIYGEPSRINFVAWSLEVEVQFYLLAPLLAVVFAIHITWIRRGLIVAAMLLFVILSGKALFGTLTQLSLAGNFQFFCAGFLLADVFLSNPPESNRYRMWDAVSVVGWPALAVLLVYHPWWTDLTIPGLILMLYMAALYGKASSGAFANLWIASIGGMCYTIYLLHNYIVAAAGMVTERIGCSLPFEARLLLQLLLLTPIVLVVSIAYYRWIEQPCMQSDWPARLKRSIQNQLAGSRTAVARPAGEM